MAKNPEITIDVSQELHNLLTTKVIHCVSLDCKNNLVHDAGYASAECGLKHIYILMDGKCEQFEARG